MRRGHDGRSMNASIEVVLTEEDQNYWVARSRHTPGLTAVGSNTNQCLHNFAFGLTEWRKKGGRVLPRPNYRWVRGGAMLYGCFVLVCIIGAVALADLAGDYDLARMRVFAFGILTAAAAFAINHLLSVLRVPDEDALHGRPTVRVSEDGYATTTARRVPDAP